MRRKITKLIAGEDEKLLIGEVILQIARWKLKECPDCGAPCKIVLGYLNKCSAEPDEHSLSDAEFYMRNIEKAWKKYLKNKIEEVKKK